MALGVTQGVATRGTTTSITVGYEPMALIAFATGTTTIDTSPAEYALSTGYTDFTNARCIDIAILDNDTSSSGNNAYRGQSTTSFVQWISSTTGAILASGSSTKAIVGGGPNWTITFTWTGTGAYLVPYLVLGGTDVTNVAVGDFLTPTSI